MKNCKRLLTLLLSISMVVTMAVTPAYAETTTSVEDTAANTVSGSIYNDVDTDASYYTALTILSKLGIFAGDDKGDFNPDDTITRAEAAAVVVRMVGLDRISGSQSTPFADVPASHWASGYIATASSMNIIVGYGDGNFGPEDPVKYEEIITMVIRAMGYDPMADNKGEWPGNYLSVASQIGVRSTEGGSVGEEASRKVVASLIFAALKSPVMEQVGYGTRSEYAIMDGSNYELKTVLSKYFDAYTLRVLVDSTDKASISQTSPAREDCAELEILNAYDVEEFEEMKDDNELLTVYDAGMLRNYLGSTIIAFVMENDENYADYDLITFSVDDDEDVVVIEDTADIVDDGSAKTTKNFGDGNNSKPVLVYWDENERKDSLTVDTDAKILINNEYFAGVKDSTVDNTIFNVTDGTVTLKDTDNDNDYDLIFIDKTITFVVDEINEKYLKITDANNYYSALRFDDYNNDDIDYTITTVDGQALEFEDLKQYDVLTIKANALRDNGSIDVDNADYYEIVVAREKVEGVVKTKGEDSNGNPEYRIEGEEYSIVPNIMDELDLGDEGIFYLDSKGRIAYYEQADVSDTATATSYAYIVRTVVDTDAFDDEWAFKFVTDTGSVKTYYAPSKGITIYDENGDSNRVDVDDFATWEDRLEGSLVAYRLNANDEIAKIYLAEGRDDNASTFSLDKSVTDARYKASTESLGTIDVDDKTIVFYVPEGAVDEDDIEVGTIKSLEDDEYYSADAYHMTRDQVARLLVVKSEMTSMNMKGNAYVVKSVSTAVMEDEDEEVSQRIVVYHEGEQITLWVDPDISEFDVEEGDVISVKLNSANEITNIKMLFDISDEEIWDVSPVVNGGSAVEDLETVAGYVTYKKSSSIAISTDPTDTDAETYYGKDAHVYIMNGNSSRTNIKVGDWSDIEEYDDNDELLVFARIYEEEITDIVIYDNVFESPSVNTPAGPTEPAEEDATYLVDITVDTFAYGTDIADIIAALEIEKWVDGSKDNTFVVDTEKVEVTGYVATTTGTQSLSVTYDGVPALGSVDITVNEPVIAYEAEAAVTVDYNATVADVLAALNIIKTVDTVEDDEFVEDEAKLDLGDFDATVLGPQVVTVSYDEVEIGEITITVEDYIVSIAASVVSLDVADTALLTALTAFGSETITATYASSATEDVTADCATSIDGTNLVFTYEGFTAEVALVVTP